MRSTVKRLSMDGLSTLVAELMGERSYREAASAWSINHMTLHGIVNPDPEREMRPPSRETLWKIAQGDHKVYRCLALAAYGIPSDVETSERSFALA